MITGPDNIPLGCCNWFKAGLDIFKFVYLCDLQNMAFFDTEKFFSQIHMPEWQLYLPRANMQWDMSSPVEVIDSSGDTIKSMI